jgi:hypothetical protein
MENIPKLIGGQFTLEDEAYDFDISTSGPFYVPGGPSGFDEGLCQAVTHSSINSPGLVTRGRTSSRASNSGDGVPSTSFRRNSGAGAASANTSASAKVLPVNSIGAPASTASTVSASSSKSAPVGDGKDFAKQELENKASVLVSLQAHSLQKFSSLTQEQQEQRLANSGFLRTNANTRTQLYLTPNGHSSSVSSVGGSGVRPPVAIPSEKAEPVAVVSAQKVTASKAHSDGHKPFLMTPLLYTCSFIILFASVCCCFVGGVRVLYIFLVCITMSSVLSLLPA